MLYSHVTHEAAAALPWLLEQMAQLEVLRLYSIPKVISFSADEADMKLVWVLTSCRPIL